MRRLLALGPVLVLAACGSPERSGGITAHLVFVDQSGVKRQELRAADVPMVVDRLEITALTAEGSTATNALGEIVQTTLYGSPADGQLQLEYGGGTWSLDAVPTGTGYQVSAKAYLGNGVDARVQGAVAFAGVVRGIDVRPGQITDAGVIELVSTGIKIPELDMEPPGPPNPVSATPQAQGETLRVTFGRSDGADGYVLAVGTSSAVDELDGLERGRTYGPDDLLAPGVVVKVVWPSSRPVRPTP